MTAAHSATPPVGGRADQPAALSDGGAMAAAPAAAPLPAASAAALPRGEPLVRFLRSTGFRLAALHAGVFSVSALALVAFIYWATAGAVSRQIDAVIRGDVLALADRYHEAGIPGLVEAIERRIAEDAENESLYLLVDGGGRRLAGNLTVMPRLEPGAAWADVGIQRGTARMPARIYQFLMPGRHRLLVGRDAQDRLRLRDQVLDALLWAAGLIVLLALAGAVLVHRLLLRRLAAVSATATAITQGDLTRRVAPSRRGDEFDMLGDTVNRMLDQIGLLMDGVRQVSNAIAHDLRTPIARVRARLEEAIRQQRDPVADRAALERAIAELDGVIAIFQAILRIAEIEAGSRRAAFTRLDLSRLLADAAEIYEAPAEEKGIALSVAVPDGLALFGDRDLVLQAAANLLDNAIKYARPGGHVALSARMLGERAEIAVADDGPGIAPAERGRVTERFYRSEASRTSPGSGLGLSLVQAVAQLHGGELRLEDNAPGVRAVLTL